MSEENNCKFIGSQGIRKSCDIYSLRDDNNYMQDIIFNNIKDKDIVYIKTDFLKLFYKNIHNLKNNIILVSGFSDYTIPNDIFTIEEFENLLKNEKIIFYYSI